METATTLTKRILNRIEQHRHDLADKQQQLDGKMKELLEQRERLAGVAKNKIETIIFPRMQELAHQFDNVRVEILHTDSDYYCVCEFSHTPRFPATVRLDIALLPGRNETFTARYDLNILPVLMEYNRNVEATFPFEGADEEFAGWVEDRILDFVDTYLRLETHPFYQKDNTVIDIVCGMHIPSTSATSTAERHGRLFYFCSEHCREAFIKGNE
ncbi:YHS domain-containing protein [Geobacter argillaceus]|uniref:YHS domain-containing protein n=1 Tax=Geobacter argillaceus TaxID=345631 RepID=A0A562VPP7_9BACT|nr:YHS domain-containing protein [Geobacter argillaceus]TWJ19751.1 YHS domain-containing protein [Geobacter argillaceus]